MELMTISILFNSTILVFWALAGVSYAMKTRQYWMLVVSGVVLIPLESFLALGGRQFPYNILAGLVTFFFALFVGLGVYYIKKRRGEYPDESVDK